MTGAQQDGVVLAGTGGQWRVRLGDGAIVARQQNEVRRSPLELSW